MTINALIKEHNQIVLKNTLAKYFSRYYKAKKVINTMDYLYIKGNIPILLVAHLDTVHKEKVTDIWIKQDNHNIITAVEGIGGDDRAGIYTITMIVKKLIKDGKKPYLLFTTDEEIGGLGAIEFTRNVKTVPVNLIIEFDRRGANDVVNYTNDYDDLTREIEKFGFIESYGSFSDISILSPHFKIASVNLSSGYYNEHSKREYINLEEVNTIIEKGYNIINSNMIYKKYPYLESAKRFLPYSNFYKYQASVLSDNICDYCYALTTNEYNEQIDAIICDACLADNDFKICPNCGELLDLHEECKCCYYYDGKEDK